MTSRPRPQGARSKSYVGGTWIGLDGEWYEDSVDLRDGQIGAVHEFGHLLGLAHPGQSLDPPAEPNSPEDYAADPRALMGGGMEMRSEYFQKWASELDSKYPAFRFHEVI